MANYCSGCGAKIEENLKFCPECGKELREEKLERPDQGMKIELGLRIAIREGLRKIFFGFLWFIGGLIVTLITLYSPSPIFLIFWGAIIFGFIDMLIGLYRYGSANRKYKKFLAQKESGMFDNYDSFKIKYINYENLYPIDDETLNRDKKKWQIISVIAFCITAVFIAGFFTGFFQLDFDMIDEDFTLTGDGTPPTEYTLIEVNYWEPYFSEGDYITIEGSVDDGKIADFLFYDTAGNPILSLCAENASSISRSWTVISSGTYTFAVWNSQNYMEVTGHVKIDW